MSGPSSDGCPSTGDVSTRDALRARILKQIRASRGHRKPDESDEDTHPTGSATGDTHPTQKTGDTHPTGEQAADPGLDDLLRDIAAYQAARVQPYGHLCAAQPSSASEWAPALPTDVFRYARVSSYPESEDTHVFRTSGTSSGARGAHAFRDLTLYDAAARTHAAHMLFPDIPRMSLVMLAEHPQHAPQSSLSYMLGRFESWFGTGAATWCLQGATLDVDALCDALGRAAKEQTPVAILGTSFAFVFAEDALGDRMFELPAGSRIMQTGGYKGRSRELEPDVLRQMLSARYGVDEAYIVAEYGMTELSSQLYEASLRDRFEGHPSPRRHLVAPPWVRATPVHPETLRPVGQGEVGVLRIDDAANLDSVAAILTSDLASLATDASQGVILHGRAADAMLRGCSLSVEEALKSRAE